MNIVNIMNIPFTEKCALHYHYQTPFLTTLRSGTTHPHHLIKKKTAAYQEHALYTVYGSNIRSRQPTLEPQTINVMYLCFSFHNSKQQANQK